jgi:hypothetical protein
LYKALTLFSDKTPLSDSFPVKDKVTLVIDTDVQGLHKIGSFCGSVTIPIEIALIGANMANHIEFNNVSF